jgi:hypothetical protein
MGEMADYANTQQGDEWGPSHMRQQGKMMATPKETAGKLTFTQIITGTWKSEKSTGFNHTVYALGSDGMVYKYSMGKGWEKMLGGAIPGTSGTGPSNNREEGEKW